MIDWIIQTIKEALQQNEFFAGGAMLGALAWIGMQLKSIPFAIWARIKRQIQYVIYLDNTNDMYDAFAAWFLEKYPKSFKRVEARMNRKHDDGRVFYKMVVRQFDDLNFIRYKKWYAMVKKDKQTLEAARDKESRHIETYTITSLFGKKALTKMLEEVHKYWNDKKAGWEGLRVIVTDRWAESRVVYIPVYKTLDMIFVEGKDDLMNDVNNFMSKKQFYIEQAIRFKRGYLLYGPPGTGKTALVFAIAHYLDKPIYYLNPSGFGDDSSFEDFVAEVDPGSIVLIEDVDVFWTNRDEKGSTPISFQSLLNVLDGLHSPHDCLIFMTSNNIDDFDEAFLRKGRLDYKMYVGYPTKEQVELFLGNFYKEDNVILKDYVANKPMVDIQDLCIKNDFLTSIKLLENE